ncbi:hypothetical protein K438DRAFT_1761841 [Mycena galopus ATCC 62051]|nr:hypothetical protein K438DRAFT_1761841 [Mycena galopus ATCC 62051]
MKVIQIAALFAPFMAAVLATPAVLPRSASDPVSRGCTTTIVCDNRPSLTAFCQAIGWDCSIESDANRKRTTQQLGIMNPQDGPDYVLLRQGSHGGRMMVERTTNGSWDEDGRITRLALRRPRACGSHQEPPGG